MRGGWQVSIIATSIVHGVPGSHCGVSCANRDGCGRARFKELCLEAGFATRRRRRKPERPSVQRKGQHPWHLAETFICLSVGTSYLQRGAQNTKQNRQTSLRHKICMRRRPGSQRQGSETNRREIFGAQNVVRRMLVSAGNVTNSDSCVEVSFWRGGVPLA